MSAADELLAALKAAKVVSSDPLSHSPYVRGEALVVTAMTDEGLDEAEKHVRRSRPWRKFKHVPIARQIVSGFTCT